MDMTDHDAIIAALRDKLDTQLSPENRLMLSYMEALDRRREAQTEELIQAFRTGVGIVRLLRWIVTIGSALAAIWAGFHAHVIVK